MPFLHRDCGKTLRSAAWLALLVLHVDGMSRAEETITRTETTVAETAYTFSPAEEELLDSVARGSFNYLWNEIGAGTGLAKDHREGVVASLAGVGYQLAALPIGVERGWIDRAAAEARAQQIMQSLRGRDDNRREGLYLHFVNAETGNIHAPFRNEASTVDHSLLLAGAMTAAQYFGGQIAEATAAMAAESNYRAFLSPDDGFLSMGWLPADNKTMDGPGELIKAKWYLNSDEERLILFLAVGCPTPKFALSATDYYRLGRNVVEKEGVGSWVGSWSGTPFNYFFSHCYIDYRRYGPDDPQAFDQPGPRVDWFENSRRALLAHRLRCLEMAGKFATFGGERWGVSPCMGFDAAGNHSYLVQRAFPNVSGSEEWKLGTIAPYAAGSAVMFTPRESLAAMREFRELKAADGSPLVWRDPAQGGYGFADSFNLDQGRASDDNVAIDVGPLLLAIENARSGLVWRLFMEHPVAKSAVERLKWERLR